MRPEHIRLLSPEKIGGEKNLLHSQLESISMLKHFESFKNLRTEELVLKVALKNKIDETAQNIALLQKLLPKPQIMPKKEQLAAKHASTKKRISSLEEEIDEIRRKLAKLH